MSHMQLSVIVVNFNGKTFLEDCLTSLNSHVSCRHEVIVVDNASTDGSVEYIVNMFPGVRVIESQANLGFAAGNNLGAQQAEGEYLLLLNTDACLRDDIQPVLTLLDRHRDIGVAGAKMLDRNLEYRLSAGYFPSPLRLIRISSLYKKDGCFSSGDFPVRPNAHYPVDWVEGSFLLTRRELWNQLGGLDEAYFMYVEDVDYCRRALEHGHKTVFCPSVSYVHHGGYGSGRISLLVKGFILYHAKFSGWFQRLFVRLVLAAGMAGRYAVNAILALSGKKERVEKAASCRDAFVACLR